VHQELLTVAASGELLHNDDTTMRVQSLKKEKAGSKRTGIFTTSIVSKMRALKMSILYRKNSLGYKTQNGARVGDLFMSLIHTCRLNGSNPFDYLSSLQRHAEAVKAKPADWLPWNYTQALASHSPA